MNQPPRSPEEPNHQAVRFSQTLPWSQLHSRLARSAPMGMAWRGTGQVHKASTLAFTSLTAGQLLHALTSRSETHSVFDSTPLPTNAYLKYGACWFLWIAGADLRCPGVAQSARLDADLIAGCLIMAVARGPVL